MRRPEARLCLGKLICTNDAQFTTIRNGRTIKICPACRERMLKVVPDADVWPL